MYKNGGYAIVSHDDANIYSKVQGAFENQKPILFYDDDNTCYFIDTIKKNDGDYVLTKGGKTFVVTSNNTLSSEGEIQEHLYQWCIYLADNDISIFGLTTKGFEIVNYITLYENGILNSNLSDDLKEQVINAISNVFTERYDNHCATYGYANTSIVSNAYLRDNEINYVVGETYKSFTLYDAESKTLINDLSADFEYDIYFDIKQLF